MGKIIWVCPSISSNLWKHTDLVGTLMGLLLHPDGKDEKGKATWNQSTSKVVQWILNSIEPTIALSLHTFSKASKMWDHLKMFYHQTNKVWRFALTHNWPNTVKETRPTKNISIVFSFVERNGLHDTTIYPGTPSPIS